MTAIANMFSQTNARKQQQAAKMEADEMRKKAQVPEADDETIMDAKKKKRMSIANRAGRAATRLSKDSSLMGGASRLGG